MVFLSLQWDRQTEPIWLSASDAAYYLDDWLDGMLLDFLKTTDFIDEETYDIVCSASGNVLPSFNVSC